MQSKNNRFQVYRDIKELVYVAELMTKNDSESHKKALSYLQIWCERKPENKISRSVYLTFKLLDIFYNNRTQNGLSFVLSRFISSECKEEEDKNNFNYKIPIYATAKNIKLPAYMIKLRHDMIHGYDLVPLEQLIEAYHDAIEWLKYNFWIPQLDQIKMVYFSSEQISEILDEYIHIMESEKSISKSYFMKISSIFDGISSNEFFSVLLTDKYLLNHKITNESEESNQKVVEFWYPMLEFLDESNQIDTLIELIFDLLGTIDLTPATLNLIRKWCLFLLDSCSPKRKSKPNKLKLSTYHKNVENVNWASILYKFIKQCVSKENMEIFKKLIAVHQPTISKENQEKILSSVERFCEDKSVENDSIESDGADEEEFITSSFCYCPFGV